MEKDNIINSEVSKDLSIYDFEDKESSDDSGFDSSLEFEKYQWTPEANKKWDDINKDMQAGNLSSQEVDKIEIGEGFVASITALQSMAVNNHVGQYFFPDSIKTSSDRKKASILALSLSKDGFWRKLSRTRYLNKQFGFGEETEEKKEKKLDFFFWRKNKQKSSR